MSLREERDASGDEVAFADLPLYDERLEPGPPEEAPAEPRVVAASLSRRGAAFAGDAATVALVVALALLSAGAVRGRGITAAGLTWAGAFALYLSFFATVLPLVFFGCTVGLALAGLHVRPGERGRGLTFSQAARRWAGTLATVAGAGLPLFWTCRDRGEPTPADRLSRRPLVPLQLSSSKEA